jgi:hypothetical protein
MLLIRVTAKEHRRIRLLGLGDYINFKAVEDDSDSPKWQKLFAFSNIIDFPWNFLQGREVRIVIDEEVRYGRVHRVESLSGRQGEPDKTDS